MAKNIAPTQEAFMNKARNIMAKYPDAYPTLEDAVSAMIDKGYTIQGYDVNGTIQLLNGGGGRSLSSAGVQPDGSIQLDVTPAAATVDNIKYNELQPKDFKSIEELDKYVERMIDGTARHSGRTEGFTDEEKTEIAQRMLDTGKFTINGESANDVLERKDIPEEDGIPAEEDGIPAEEEAPMDENKSEDELAQTAKDRAKQYIEQEKKAYEDAYNEEDEDDATSGEANKGLAATQQVISKLGGSSTMLFNYLKSHPEDARTILVKMRPLIEKSKDLATLAPAKLTTFLDNWAGKLLVGSDKVSKGGVVSNFIKDYVGIKSPFSAQSSTTKHVVRALGKTNADNPGILNKSVGTVTKDSNAYSNLSTSQKISGALQVAAMATAVLDGAVNSKNNYDNGVIKQSDNPLVSSAYKFFDYLDRAGTQVLPVLGLANTAYDFVESGEKDKNGLAKDRGGVLSKLGLDFWIEKDADKRKENKKNLDWMHDQGYKEQIMIGALMGPSTQKGTKARDAEDTSKAMNKMSKLNGTDNSGYNAMAAATNYIVRMNKATGAKINSTNGKDMSAITMKEIYDGYTWKKNKDGKYDWVDKKTGVPLSVIIDGISQETGRNSTLKPIKNMNEETINGVEDNSKETPPEDIPMNEDTLNLDTPKKETQKKGTSFSNTRSYSKNILKSSKK